MTLHVSSMYLWSICCMTNTVRRWEFKDVSDVGSAPKELTLYLGNNSAGKGTEVEQGGADHRRRWGAGKAQTADTTQVLEESLSLTKLGVGRSFQAAGRAGLKSRRVFWGAVYGSSCQMKSRCAGCGEKCKRWGWRSKQRASREGTWMSC